MQLSFEIIFWEGWEIKISFLKVFVIYLVITPKLNYAVLLHFGLDIIKWNTVNATIAKEKILPKWLGFKLPFQNLASNV